MTVLNIFELDDTENQNVIACLPEGKHVIGRGGILQVTDKRVSRKHAVIEVLSDKVYLTSVHVNPCFFKAANGKTLSVVSQNQQNELNDGDQFALLPESCWFKVKIKKELPLNGPLNGLADSTAEINGKRFHDTNLEENNLDSDSKRARLSTMSNETSTHISVNSATTSNITSELESNVQNDESSHSHQENGQIGEHLQDSNIEESNTSLNLAETAIITDELEDIKREIKEEPREHEMEDIPSNTSHNLLENSSDNTLNPVDKPSTSNAVIKEEPSNISNNEDDIREPGIPSQSNEVMSDQQLEVKTENQDDENNLDNEQPEVGTENKDNNQNTDGASGSDAGAKKVRREKCWYGDRCYRKNPNHRDSFAHPGDQDYDSDPDDDRPDCPFGPNCYRKNLEHRRDYKHTGKPAPKPQPTSPSPPATPQNQPPKQKKPRTAGAKKPKPQYDFDDSEDYDLDDPFINDGSSDDFNPSDEIDGDSSFEDSQEVEESQERKRMLKEAKKFTKKGKKT